MRKLSNAIIAGIVILLSGCEASLKDSAEGACRAEIEMPSWNKGAELCGYEVEFFDEDMKPASAFVPAGKPALKARVSASCPTPFLAYPVFWTEGADGARRKARFFRPAGCVFPHSRRMEWSEGFSASLLSSIYMGADSADKAGVCCSYFNWSRLRQKVKEAEAEHGSPWLLDGKKIIEAIAAQKFGAYTVKLSESAKRKLPKKPFSEIIEAAYSIMGLNPDADNRMELWTDYVPSDSITGKSEGEFLVRPDSAGKATARFFAPQANSVIVLPFD